MLFSDFLFLPQCKQFHSNATNHWKRQQSQNKVHRTPHKHCIQKMYMLGGEMIYLIIYFFWSCVNQNYAFDIYNFLFVFFFSLTFRYLLFVCLFCVQFGMMVELWLLLTIWNVHNWSESVHRHTTIWMPRSHRFSAWQRENDCCERIKRYCGLTSVKSTNIVHVCMCMCIAHAYVYVRFSLSRPFFCLFPAVCMCTAFLCYSTLVSVSIHTYTFAFCGL